MKTILVVDDSKMLRTMLCDILKENNFNTIEAADGMEGLDKIESNEVVMIITDIIMPNYDGADFLEMVTTLHPEIKLLVVTSLVSPNELYNKAKDMVGGENIIRKPFKEQDIIAKVKRLLP